MKKGYYYYKIFEPTETMFYRAAETVAYDSLKRARERAKELNITKGYIIRYHIYRGIEDKEYKL